MKLNDDPFRRTGPQVNSGEAELTKPDLRDPKVVLSLLEADQVVAAKQQTRFGRRQLSFRVRLMLWGLRVYVVVMFVIVAVSVFRALHGAR